MGERIKKKRRGAAVVEAAVTLPIILLLVIGTVEVCNIIFLKQALKVMAFEGARITIIPDSTFNDVDKQVRGLADARGIDIDSVAIDPPNFSDAAAGSFVEVTVTSSANQTKRSQFFSRSSQSESVFIMKESD